MAEENTSKAESQKSNDSEAEAKETKTVKSTVVEGKKAKPAATGKATKAKKTKPPVVEDKPFPEFMQQHFTPALKKAFAGEGVTDIELEFTQKKLAIIGANDEPCWQIIGKWNQGQRQFNLYFLDENIKGKKAFSYTTSSNIPSTIESFMIDERRVTLDLMVMYTLQRLNGQKWLTRN